MSDLVGKPEDRFSHNEAHMLNVQRRNIEKVVIIPNQGFPHFMLNVYVRRKLDYRLGTSVYTEVIQPKLINTKTKINIY